MPLVLKRTKDDLPGSIPGEDYVVFSGALRLGRIHKVLLTGGRMRWHCWGRTIESRTTAIPTR